MNTERPANITVPPVAYPRANAPERFHLTESCATPTVYVSVICAGRAPAITHSPPPTSLSGTRRDPSNAARSWTNVA